MPRELHIWDFDGTLFRSPEKPAGWTRGKDWWSHPDSLGRPCVPDAPDASWWVPGSVPAAKHSISQADVVAVLATGRQDHTHSRWRIPELLGQAGLNFDRVFLSPGGVTAAFKQWVAISILRHLPEIETVQMWDDTQANLDAVGSVIGSRQYIPHLVRSTPKEVSCPVAEPEMDRAASRIVARWLARR